MAGNQLIFSFAGDDSKLTPVVQRTKKNIQRLVTAQQNLNKKFEKGSITADEYAKKSQKISTMMNRETKEGKKLGITVKNLTQNFKQLNKAAGKGGDGSSGAGLAITELGRGLADFKAGGGFQDFGRGMMGATNNLEQLANVMKNVVNKTGGFKSALSALGTAFTGPAGIVFAITLVLNFLPEIVNFFQSFTGEAEMTKEEIERLNQELEDFHNQLKRIHKIQSDVLGMFVDPEVEKDRRRFVSAKGNKNKLNAVAGDVAFKIEDLEGQVTRDRDTTARILKRWDKLTPEEREYWEAQFKIFEQRAQQLKDYRKLLGMIEKELDRLDPKAPKKNNTSGLSKEDKAMKDIRDEMAFQEKLRRAQGKSEEEILQYKLKALKAIDKSVVGAKNYKKVLQDIQVIEAQIANLPGKKGTTDSGVGKSPEDKLTEKFQEDVAHLKALLDEDKISVDEYIDRLSNLSVAYQQMINAINSGNMELGEGFSKVIEGGLEGMIGGFAAAIGSGQDFGKGLLKGVGTILVQLGGMLIATGVGIEGFKKALKSLQGPVAIAAGAAMVALGSAFANAANKAGGGGGKAYGAGSTSSSASGGPRGIQPANTKPIAVAKVKGQDLILAIENANYSRRGYLPN